MVYCCTCPDRVQVLEDRVRGAPRVRCSPNTGGKNVSSADMPAAGQACEDGAGKRADDRNPAVGPVAGAFALDRQDEVRDARPEVTCGVDRVPGGLSLIHI